MAFKGPTVPHRTIRSMALTKGTAAAGFVGAPEGMLAEVSIDGGAPTPPPPALARREPDALPSPFKTNG